MNSQMNPTQPVNNKEEVPLEHYLERYRCADPVAVAERTHTQYDEAGGAFLLTFLGREYSVSWPDLAVSCTDGKEGWEPLTHTNQSKLLVLRYLLEGQALPGTGKFLTFREVPWGEVYIRQFTGRCISRLAFTYGNRLDDYRQRMNRLGAAVIKDSDAGFSIEVFPGFEMRFLLWEGDDEFPPSAQILFSDNFAAAFHAEDLVVAAEVVIGSIKFS